MKLSVIVAGFGILALSACGPNPRASTQMIPASQGSSSAMPQTSNSMPVGDTVNAPRTPATGAVSTPVRSY